MPQFFVRSLERWLVVAKYQVEAPTLDQAVQSKAGDVAYDEHKHDGSGDELIEVLESYSGGLMPPVPTAVTLAGTYPVPVCCWQSDSGRSHLVRSGQTADLLFQVAVSTAGGGRETLEIQTRDRRLVWVWAWHVDAAGRLHMAAPMFTLDGPSHKVRRQREAALAALLSELAGAPVHP
ncbi:MAG: hypothetical protein KKA73_07855 [Chloroflexi bacterium]|nr:hypothetical protein [Chloroflexota bacterium]MBU1747587.1 hypothetical protein [Chloroflexota bacterium]